MRSSVTSFLSIVSIALAVADDRDAVGDLLDLVELVADDDRRDPLALEVQDQVEQMIGVLVVEGRGRLVEDEQLHALRERLRDLDELLLADADVLDLGGRVLFQADTREELLRLLVGLVPVDEAERALDLVVEEDVLGDRQVRAERQLLVDDDDALRLAVAQVVEVHGLVFEDDLALVGAGRVDAREHLHEGRFAGAVLAADGVDLAALDLERDVLQRLDAGERLRDGPHLEDVGSHGGADLPWSCCSSSERNGFGTREESRWRGDHPPRHRTSLSGDTDW